MVEPIRGTHVPIFLPGDGCGSIRAWFVRENDTVTKGQKIAEIVPASPDASIDGVLSSDYNGVIGSLHARLGVPVENKPILEIIIDQQGTVECFSTPKTVRRKTRASSSGKYNTGPLVDAIDQLMRKRRDVENTVAKMENATEKEFYKEVLDEIDDQIKAKRVLMLEMYKELKEREQRRYNSGYLPYSLPRTEYERLTKDIPRWKIHKSGRCRPNNTLTLMTDEHETPKLFKDQVYGISTSTYPYMDFKKARDGDPICDQFRLMLSKKNAIITVADGCNWGKHVVEAARRSTKGFTDMINRERLRMTDTHRLCNLFLSGMCAAHNSIIRGDDPDRQIGTTTLIGGMLLQLADEENREVVENSDDEDELASPRESTLSLLARTTSDPHPVDYVPPPWAFVFVSVGDCKAFLYSPKTHSITEITPDSRNQNAADASDCGGRIGPYVEGGPDFRNLTVYLKTVEEGDILFICSDGVHDNFDPQHFGFTPRDFNLDEDDWAAADPLEVNAAKSKWRKDKMLELLCTVDEVTPKTLSEVFVDFCKATCKSSQDFMQQNLGKKLPNDYKLYPGKMDHTTIVAIRIGEFDDDAITEARRLKDNPPNANSTAEVPKTIIQHVKAAALSLKKLSSIAKEGGDVETFEAATEQAISTTTALLDCASSWEYAQDVNMVKAISAKAIVGSKKLFALRDASEDEKAVLEKQLDKLLAGAATVLKKLVKTELQVTGASS